MPMPNYHACRIVAPESVKENSFRTVKSSIDGKPVLVRFARSGDGSSWVRQSVLFPIESWEESEAKAACSGTFEPAKTAERVGMALGTSVKNDLSDSDFAYIEPGGHKDSEGKTVPRSLRHYPVSRQGKTDPDLVRAALRYIGKELSVGDPEAKRIARASYPKVLAAAKRLGISVSDR